MFMGGNHICLQVLILDYGISATDVQGKINSGYLAFFFPLPTIEIDVRICE